MFEKRKKEEVGVAVLCCVVLCVTWDDGKVLEFQVASDETEGGK